MSGWEDVFEPEPVPEWLLAFDAAPVQAVDALLGRRFYFGSLNAADPEELLVDWTVLLSGNGFAARLDEALAAWVEENWGVFPETMTAARLADAWSRLFNVVAHLEDLPRTAAALGGRFDDREDFLGPLSTGPSRDPLGRYLAAVARFQADLSLAPFWWTLCGLPDGVPFYHAPYAITGLLGLPPLDESQSGGFQEQVAYGIVRLASALLRRVEAHEIQKARAQDEWLWTVRLAMARLPFPTRWQEVFEEVIYRGMPDECRAWLETALPGLGSKPPGQGSDIPFWRDKAQPIAQALRAGRAGAVDQARELLGEQERYARHSGNSRFLVRSLHNFSKATWARDPRLAVQWSELALAWEPWDAYSWNTLIQALWRAQGIEAALPLAWEAVERFPEDVVARTGLAEVLKELGRLSEAEAIYRETVAQFSTNVVARTGLAEVLKELGRLSEAEEIYRQAMADFPGNMVAPVGLAAVLRLKGRELLPEALRLVETVLVLGGRENQAAAFAEKGRILEKMERWSEAAEAFQKGSSFEKPPAARPGTAPQQAPEERKGAPEPEQPRQQSAHRGGEVVSTVPRSGVVPQIVTRFTPDRVGPRARPYLKRGVRAARTSEARFYRRWARRGGDPGSGRLPEELRRRAEALLESILAVYPNDSRALAEKGFLLLESRRLDEARELLGSALERLPGTPVLLSALARAEREQAQAQSQRLNDEALAAVFAAPDRLRGLGGFEPLIHLQKGRAVLALQDGQVRRERAAKELNRLHQWMRPHLGPELETFEAWWSSRLNEQIFLPLPPDASVTPEVVEELSSRLDARAVEIDLLDEAYSLRKDPRAEAVVAR